MIANLGAHLMNLVGFFSPYNDNDAQPTTAGSHSNILKIFSWTILKI